MPDVLAKVKQDLGRDAVILHTRTVKRGGVLGVGARSMVEVTATADDRVTAMRRQRATAADDPPLIQAGVKGPPPSTSPSRGQGPRVEERPVAGTCDRVLPAREIGIAVPIPSVPAADPALRAELGEIRRMVQELMRRQRQARTPKIPSELIDYYTDLIAQDVASELAVQVIGRLRDRAAPLLGKLDVAQDVDAALDATIRSELMQAVAEMIPPAAPLEISAIGRPTVVAFVGPTGVGKTTTIAKLSANMKLREGKQVGLITIDAYRIAAIEQLRTYATIMDVPLHAVATPEDMPVALERLVDRDVVLIDTAGRSQRDDMRINDLNRFLTAARPDQVHLVLSSTSRESTIMESIRKFAVCGASHLIFTKIDEAIGFGVLLNVLRTVDMRLSYLTNGQSVPGDIERGSAQRIAELIVAKATR